MPRRIGARDGRHGSLPVRSGPSSLERVRTRWLVHLQYPGGALRMRDVSPRLTGRGDHARVRGPLSRRPRSADGAGSACPPEDASRGGRRRDRAARGVPSRGRSGWPDAAPVAHPCPAHSLHAAAGDSHPLVASPLTRPNRAPNAHGYSRRRYPGRSIGHLRRITGPLSGVPARTPCPELRISDDSSACAKPGCSADLASVPPMRLGLRARRDGT